MILSVCNLFYSININNQNSLVNVLLSKCGHMGQRPESKDYLNDLYDFKFSYSYHVIVKFCTRVFKINNISLRYSRIK